MDPTKSSEVERNRVLAERFKEWAAKGPDICKKEVGLAWVNITGRPVKIALYCQGRPGHESDADERKRDHHHTFKWSAK